MIYLSYIYASLFKSVSQVGHDGIPPGSGWLLKEIEIDTPIKGRSYFITCNSWLSTEKGDGKIIRKFDINDATTKISTYKNC